MKWGPRTGKPNQTGHEGMPGGLPCCQIKRKPRLGFCRLQANSGKRLAVRAQAARRLVLATADTCPPRSRTPDTSAGREGTVHDGGLGPSARRPAAGTCRHDQQTLLNRGQASTEAVPGCLSSPGRRSLWQTLGRMGAEVGRPKARRSAFVRLRGSETPDTARACCLRWPGRRKSMQ